MKYRFAFYIGIIVISMVIITASVYYLLGGTDKVEVFQLPAEQKIIVGKAFQGRPTDPTIERNFLAARRLLLDSAIIGTLTIVDYKSDTLENNEVSFFIGIAIKDRMVEVPEGFEVRKFSTQQKFALFLSMHPLVRPTSKKIEQMLTSTADSAGYDLKNFFIELHYYDDSMSVEAYARD